MGRYVAVGSGVGVGVADGTGVGVAVRDGLGVALGVERLGTGDDVGPGIVVVTCEQAISRQIEITRKERSGALAKHYPPC